MTPEKTAAEARRQISAEWARVGGGFTVAPAEHAVVIEDLLARSAAQAPGDPRLFFVAATWLGVHHHLVDVRRLGRELHALRGLASAAAGAMLSVANEVAGTPRLEAVERRCRPLAEPRPLFDRIAGNPLLAEFARKDALPVFSRWGLWHGELSLKPGAVKPVRWILERCPELRIRALIGAGLDAEIVEALREQPHTVAELARSTGASYASTHEAAARLSARGLVQAVEAEDRRGLTLPPRIERWIECFPPDAEPHPVRG